MLSDLFRVYFGSLQKIERKIQKDFNDFDKFFVSSAYFFLDFNPDVVSAMTGTEISEKFTVIMIGAVNFLLHAALFDFGATVVNRFRDAFSRDSM